MQFTKANFKVLLAKSEGLTLIPLKKRNNIVANLLESNSAEQMKVFKILLIEQKELIEAESAYQKSISKALDNFTVKVQSIQKTAVKNVRVKAENIERTKEEQTMEKLLSQLN